MSSRQEILEKIQQLRLDQTELPTIPEFKNPLNTEEEFKASIEANKGEVISQEKLMSWISESGFQKILNFSQLINLNTTYARIDDAHELDQLQVAIIDGQFGVGENGAIWITNDQVPFRAIPFITEHLVIVLPKNEIVPTMHQAYIKTSSQSYSFGLFIAGPSKTADIEQSLVIGAHGAKSLRVVLV